MSALAFLTELSRQGVEIWVDGDQLHCRAPKGVMTAALRSKLAEYKAELLILLSQRQDTALNWATWAITAISRWKLLTWIWPVPCLS